MIVYLLVLCSLFSVFASFGEVRLLSEYDSSSLIELAEAERHLIQIITDELRSATTDDKNYDSEDYNMLQDVGYFLEFLQEETGYPYKVNVEVYLGHPNNRFKVVERFLYDWPQLHQIMNEVDLEVDVMDHFKRSTQRLRNHQDLSILVEELNNLIDIYDLELDDVISGLPLGNSMFRGHPLNTGNLHILTTISRDLGHVTHCVTWGRQTDSDLMSAVEPFTIPGEEHWIAFYLVYLECLVEAGELLTVIDVKQEIFAHYSEDAIVKAKVKAILAQNKKVKPRDISSSWTVTKCRLPEIIPSSQCICDIRQIHHLKIADQKRVHIRGYEIYRDIVERDIPLIQLLGYPWLLVVNRGTFPRPVAVVSAVIYLNQNEGLLYSALDPPVLCPLLEGADRTHIYSLSRD